MLRSDSACSTVIRATNTIAIDYHLVSPSVTEACQLAARRWLVEILKRQAPSNARLCVNEEEEMAAEKCESTYNIQYNRNAYDSVRDGRGRKIPQPSQTAVGVKHMSETGEEALTTNTITI